MNIAFQIKAQFYPSYISLSIICCSGPLFPIMLKHVLQTPFVGIFWLEDLRKIKGTHQLIIYINVLIKVLSLDAI